MDFKTLKFEDATRLSRIFSLRDNRTCDSTVIDTYIWNGLYKSKIYLEDEAALIVMEDKDGFFAAMPYCTEDRLVEYFEKLKNYFNTVLNCPLRIQLADEEAMNAIGLFDDPDYMVNEEIDLKDYLYSAEKMRTLAGGKLSKRRNKINRFSREYAGIWEYRSLSRNDSYIMEEFIDKWVERKLSDGTKYEENLMCEKEGIIDVLRNWDKVPFKAGGIFIRGRLEAFTIGSYNPREKMVIISVEKANRDIYGLYQVINQQFLLNTYEDAEIINKEDDMGLEELRFAKKGYRPIGFARKYQVIQKW